MKDISRAFSILGVQQGEEKLVGLLFAHTFLNGLHLGFVFTCAYTLFLESFGSRLLPIIYIVAAFVGTGITSVLMAVRKKSSLRSYVSAILTLGFCALIALRLGVGFKAAAFALPVWAEIWLCLLNIEYYAIVGKVINVRQGKRLMALIRSGAFIAGTAGGFATGPLVGLIGVANLLAFSAGVLLLTLALLGKIFKAFPEQLGEPVKSPSTPDGAEKARNLEGLAWKEVLGNRFVSLIFGMCVCYTLSYYFIDNAFFDLAQKQYPSKDQMAGFLGRFGAVVQVLTLFNLLFVSGWALNRFGVHIGLLAVPASVFAAGVAACLSGFTGNVPLVFYSLAFMRLARSVLAPSMLHPSMGILYQALPGNQRGWATSVASGVLDPIAGGAAGLLLLLFMNVLKMDGAQLAGAMLVVPAAWIAFAFLTRKEYVAALKKAIARRKLGVEALDFQDGSSIRLMEKSLQSDFDAEVVYGMDALLAMKRPNVASLLIELAGRRSARVRIEALKRIERNRFFELAPALKNRLEEEKDAEPFAQLLLTLSALDEENAFEILEPHLESREPGIRKAALVGLLKNGGIDGVLSAGGRLNELLKSERPDDRILAAEALGEIGVKSYYRPLKALLQDADVRVKKSALAAAAKLKNVRLADRIIRMLDERDLLGDAVNALSALGEEALPVLDLAIDGAHSRETRIRLIRCCRKIGGAAGAAVIAKRLDEPDQQLRHQALINLAALRFQSDNSMKPALAAAIQSELENAAWTLNLLDALRGNGASLLSQALEGELKGQRDRCLLLLSFLWPPDTILDARRILEGASDEKRAFALEILENAVDRETFNQVLPLLDGNREAQTAQILKKHPQRKLSHTEALKEIMDRTAGRISIWTRACAAYLAAQDERKEDHADAVAALLGDPDPFVRETAAGALFKIDRKAFASKLIELRGDPSRIVSATVSRLAAQTEAA